MSHSFWYTDEDYVRRIRDILGDIDLDPASSAEANRNILASTIFTEDNSCLERDWPKVQTAFMNPPYSSDCGTSKPFVKKWLIEFHRKRFQNGIVLVNASPASSWFQMLLRNCSLVCFPDSRIAFDEDVEALWNSRYKDVEDPERGLTAREQADYYRVQALLREGETVKTGTSPRYDNAIFLFSHDTPAASPVRERFDSILGQFGTILKRT